MDNIERNRHSINMAQKFKISKEQARGVFK